ncbi:MAG: hypothetical protein SH848_02850 [Saprospiraceae bacterium]|nr:hypothetical protein [Saprospiraceae bacterium]MDZ4702839.1 hypothetical protein [Saprospiraceae bacterium]
MKIIAILLLLLGCALVVILGLIYFFLLIMSFDAPGSADAPGAWGMRLLFLLPLIGLIVAVVLSFSAIQAGNYVRSARIGLVFVVAIIGALAFLFLSQRDNDKYVNEMRAQELEDAKHPVQQFFRPTEHGTDTIIVFPDRIVAYRVFNETYNRTIGGPIGELNETRDAIRLNTLQEDFLKREEYEEFVNSAGKKFTETFFFK